MASTHCEKHRICAPTCADCQRLRGRERKAKGQAAPISRYADGRLRTAHSEAFRRMTEIGLRLEREKRS